MQKTQNKLCNWKEAQAKVETWQRQEDKIVFTNGCFDIVHLGHIDYLEKARHLGDRLVVGVNTDNSVKRLKGEQRPVQDEYARLRMLAAFEFVDLVVLFEQDTPKELIEFLKPNILTKGDDYSIENIVGADFVLANNGEVKTISLVEGYSTSNIIGKIKNFS